MTISLTVKRTRCWRYIAKNLRVLYNKLNRRIKRHLGIYSAIYECDVQGKTSLWG